MLLYMLVLNILSHHLVSDLPPVQSCTTHMYAYTCIYTYHRWPLAGLLSLAALRAVVPTVRVRSDLCRTMLQYSGSSVWPSNLIHCIIPWYIGKNRICIAAYEKYGIRAETTTKIVTIQKEGAGARHSTKTL